MTPEMWKRQGRSAPTVRPILVVTASVGGASGWRQRTIPETGLRVSACASRAAMDPEQRVALASWTVLPSPGRRPQHDMEGAR